MVNFSNPTEKSPFFYVGRYKSPLLYHYVCLPHADEKSAQQKGFLPFDGGMILDGHCFLPSSQRQKIFDETYSALKKKDSAFFSVFFETAKQEIEKMLDSSKTIGEKGSVNPHTVERFFNAMRDMEYPWWTTLPIGDALEKFLIEESKKNNWDDDTVQSFFTLEKPTPLIKQQRAAKNLYKKLKEKDLLTQDGGSSSEEILKVIKEKYFQIYKELENHVKEYRWYGMMHWWGSPLTLNKLIEELQTFSHTDKVTQKEGDVPREFFWLKDISSELSYWRQMCADTCAITSLTVLENLGVIAKKTMGLQYEQARWLSPLEFLEGMKTGTSPSKKILEERSEGFGVIADRDNIKIITGKELKNLLAKFFRPVESVEKIKGTVASRGTARGYVKVILAPDEIGKITKGDILVASETTPDFMPAISKAAAIVTDLGGISSHASIVSREFGIPCIVGTKVATRVLKDGDMIEVDAESGIVRKLS